MALGIVFPGDDVLLVGGNVPARKVTLVPDNNYPAGGYPFSGALVGGAATGGGVIANNGVVGVQVLNQNTAGLLYQLVYNAQAGTVTFLTASAQVAAGTDLSQTTFSVLVLLAGL